MPVVNLTNVLYSLSTPLKHSQTLTEHTTRQHLLLIEQSSHTKLILWNVQLWIHAAENVHFINGMSADWCSPGTVLWLTGQDACQQFAQHTSRSSTTEASSPPADGCLVRMAKCSCKLFRTLRGCRSDTSRMQPVDRWPVCRQRRVLGTTLTGCNQAINDLPVDEFLERH